AHRVEDRGEEVGAVAPALDDELPPALAVVEPGGFGQHPERVDGPARRRRGAFGLRGAVPLADGFVLRFAPLVAHRQGHEPLRAEPGPWWRTPRTCTVEAAEAFAGASVGMGHPPRAQTTSRQAR